MPAYSSNMQDALDQATVTPDPSSADKQGEQTSECEIRELIKLRLRRLVKSQSQALLIEEMEVCLGRARVDLAVIGDDLLGIEIKGPKDDVTRLPAQVNAYSRCFDRVVLIVHEALALRAAPLIPPWWGLVVGAATTSGSVRYRFERCAQINPNLDFDALLSLLWRDELEALLRNTLGDMPKPRATKQSLRAELLSRVAPLELHRATLKKLRDRVAWRTSPLYRLNSRQSVWSSAVKVM
jgi:hypothetical protein